MTIKNKIIVEDYSPEWPVIFQKLKSVYETFLGNLVCDIQHVGSTSVVGLAAKPTIDIDLIIENNEFLKPVIAKLSKLGYEHQGDLGIKEREVFKRKSEKTPEDGSNRVWPKHNLYVCPKYSISLQNHLKFRDYLRSNPRKVKQYSELKKKLALENPFNIDLYIEKKTPFIIEILNEIGFDKNELDHIIEQNQVKT